MKIESASQRSRQTSVALRTTLPDGKWSMDCLAHDEMDSCGHWVHEVYIPSELLGAYALEEGRVWTVWSQSFLDFMGTKIMALEEGWET